MTDELTPSLARRPVIDTDLDKTNRMQRLASAIGDALHPLIDGKTILAADIMIIVQHPDDKVGCSHINIGSDDEVKAWASKQSLRHHLGALGAPDNSESRRVAVAKKH